MPQASSSSRPASLRRCSVLAYSAVGRLALVAPLVLVLWAVVAWAWGGA